MGVISNSRKIERCECIQDNIILPIDHIKHKVTKSIPELPSLIFWYSCTSFGKYNMKKTRMRIFAISVIADSPNLHSNNSSAIDAMSARLK